MNKSTVNIYFPHLRSSHVPSQSLSPRGKNYADLWYHRLVLPVLELYINGNASPLMLVAIVCLFSFPCSIPFTNISQFI